MAAEKKTVKSCDFINQILSKILSELGFCVGRHPLWFISTPLVVTALFASGFLRLKVLKNVEDLYLPINERSIHDRSIIEKLFPENVTDFDFNRLTRMKIFGCVEAKAKDGRTMLRESVFRELKILDWMVRNISVKYDTYNLFYADICRRINKNCFDNDILKLMNNNHNNNRDLKSNKISIKYPLDINVSNAVSYGINLRDVITDLNDSVHELKTIRLFYFVDYNNSLEYDIALDWERRFLNIFLKITFHDINIFSFTGNNFNDELNKISIRMLPYMFISGLIIICFAVLSCMTTDCISSKPTMGFVACSSPIFSVVAAFGILLLCGLEYSQINILIPFVVLGIGLNDSFLLLTSWRRTSRKMCIENRMSKVYSNTAASITITSLTNIVIFMIGITIPFRIVKIICIYMSVSLLMNYMYQMAFFGGCLAISGYREAKNLHAIFLTSIAPKEELGKEERTEMKCYNYLGRLLSFKATKFIILLAFLIYLTGGIYLIRYSRSSIDFIDFFHKNIKNNEKYFAKYPDRIHVVIDEPVDYSNSNIQHKIDNLTISFENLLNITENKWTESWLREYLNYLNSKQSSISLIGYNTTDFTEVLLNDFLKFKWAKRFKKDIVFSQDRKTILASRFFIQSTFGNSISERETIYKMFNLVDSSDLPVRVFNPRFLYYNRYDKIMSSTGQFVCFSFIVVCFIYVLCIPNIIYVFCIALTILSIEIITVGYMSKWEVCFNPISMVLLIVMNGFCVDYSFHLSYAFINSKRNSPNDKMKDALYSTGYPISQGCIVTILSATVLIFAPYALFINMFKIIFLLVIAILFHCLFFLPVVLSLLCNVSFYFKNTDDTLSDKKLPETELLQ